MGNAEEPPDGSTGTLSARLEGARPNADRLKKSHTEALVERALFDRKVEPVRVGRFELIEFLGSGSMGTVYGAYDPELDRRVALKVLHSTGPQSSEPLRREARALAKLSHPNIVPIHDATTIDGRLVLVMEYVDGHTVRDWLEQPRDWREIVPVFVQMARGLEAAHAVGIVHRDIKPHNAIIGDDGRVRVLDFGLARYRADDASDRAKDAVDLDELTVTRGVGGTPAFMSPEQFRGKHIGPSADQFGFCVALYRALFRQRPFGGDDIASLRRSVEAGDIRSPPQAHGVPSRIVATLRTGLEPKSADRHSSMRDVIDALEHDPAVRRRRWAMGTAVASLLVLALWLLLRESPSQAASCDGGRERLSESWSASKQQALTGHLRAVGGDYAGELVGPLLARAHAYAEQFAERYRATCEAYQRGDYSDRLYDVRIACLGRRMDGLESAVDALLEADGAEAKRAMDAVVNLPELSLCDDTDALLAREPLPDAPKLRQRVEEVRQILARVAALRNIGRTAAADAVAKAAIATATDIGFAPLLAEAHLAMGRLMLASEKYAAATVHLGSAEGLALEHQLLPIAVEAAARRFYCEAMDGRTIESITEQARVVTPLSRGLPDGGFARLLLLNNLGVANMSAGDRQQARRYFEQAYSELPDGYASRHPELLSITKNLAMVTRDAEERVRLATAAMDGIALQLGPHHPLTLEFAIGLAHYTPNPRDAVHGLEPTCAAYDRLHRGHSIARLRCLYFLGYLQAELGRTADARDTFERARTLGPADDWPPFVMMWWTLAVANGHALAGQHKQAILLLEPLLGPEPDTSTHWSARESRAHILQGLAASRLAQGDRDAASRDLEEAVRLFESVQDANQDIENRHRLAASRYALGRLLHAQGRVVGSRPLLVAAKEWYERAGPTEFANRLAEIRVLLGRR